MAGTGGRWAHVQKYIVTPSQHFSWTSATIHPDMSCKHPWALARGNTGNRTIDTTLTTLLSKLIQSWSVSILTRSTEMYSQTFYCTPWVRVLTRIKRSHPGTNDYSTRRGRPPTWAHIILQTFYSIMQVMLLHTKCIPDLHMVPCTTNNMWTVWIHSCYSRFKSSFNFNGP